MTALYESQPATNVLLIDNDPESLPSVQSTLARISGVDVAIDHVEQLSSGLNLIRRKKFDVVFLDHLAPELSMIEFYHRIHEISPGTLVVVFAESSKANIASEINSHASFEHLMVGKIKTDVVERAILRVVERREMIAELETTRKRLQNILENNADALLALDSHGEVIFANPAAEQLFGFSSTDLIGEVVGFPLIDGESQEIDIFDRKRGGIRTGEMRLAATEWGGREAFVASIRDITVRKESENSLKLSAKVIDRASDGVMVTDVSGNILMVNPAFTRITGFREDDVIGKKPSVLHSDKHDDHFYKELWRNLLASGQWQGEIWNRRKNGEAFLQRTTITAIHDTSGAVVRYASLFSDITEQRENEQMIAYQAYHDALTGLPNRLLFLDRVKSSLSRIRREGKKLCIMFIDLDNFKRVNDSFGHNVGDMLLQGVAIRLISCLREGDTVSRHSGDEFTVLLEHIEEEEDAVKAASNVITALSESYLFKGEDLNSSVSVGLAIAPNDGEDPETLIKHADMAMYQAKERGKNQFQLFDHGMNERVTKRISFENQLKRAIERQEFTVYYQPKVSLSSNTISSAEALVRWTPPGGTVISPAEFIPIAEETGLIVPLGEWVLSRACEQMLRWHNNGHDSLVISVNLSARQLDQRNLPEIIQSTLLETGLPPDSLCMEMTESALTQNIDVTTENMLALKNMGIKISLDDFGTGYSSLSFLRRFPLDEIKIDQSFVRKLPSDPHDSAIAATIVSLAHYLNLRVVAEGVERDEQLEFFRSTGCHEVQGYLFSRPLPSNDFEKLLERGLDFSDGVCDS